MRETLARRLDAPIEKLLSRLLRRRLARLSAQRAREVGTEPAAWNSYLHAEQERLIRTYAKGRSFADIGCLWMIHGACVFLAEDAGATRATGVDHHPATEEWHATRKELGSDARFVQGDLHEQSTVEEMGRHDVVWCSGVMYHTPHPVLAITRLLEMTNEYLLVGTKSLPAVPGLPALAAFYPGLERPERDIYLPVAGEGVEVDYDRERPFANWFWGLTPEAMLAIARSVADVELVERLDLPWLERHDDVCLVLRKTSDQ
jgi:hypothetical protein